MSKLLNELNIMKLKLYVHIMPSGIFTLGLESEIFCERPSKYYMPKLLTLEKEDNVIIYVCSYSHRSYIVIDPSTCGACPPSLLDKNSAPSRDTTCASKNP